MFSLEHDREEDGDTGVVIGKLRLYVVGILGGQESSHFLLDTGKFSSEL